MRQQADDCGAAEKANHPAPGRTDRAFRPAAHEPESLIERRDRLPARDPPGAAAPDQEAAKGDDEGRHAEIGNDIALQRADQDADDKSNRECDRPGGGIVEAEKLRQQIGLNDPHDHAEEAEHRADRQIDVADDDDQHHAGRHDRDRRRLHRQIPKIARCQKQAAGENVQGDPDGGQRADHAEHARVDLGGFEKAGEGRRAGCHRCRTRRPVAFAGHDVRQLGAHERALSPCGRRQRRRPIRHVRMKGRGAPLTHSCRGDSEPPSPARFSE